MSTKRETGSASAIGRILGLTSPWRVQQMRVAANGKSIDVLVGRMREHRSWLGQSRWEIVDGPRHVWRHMDIGGMPTFIHAVLENETALFEQPWAGPREQHFSRAMASYLVELMCGGAELGAICGLHGIGLDALWRFKFALDHDQAGLLEHAPIQRLRQREALQRAKPSEVLGASAEGDAEPGAEAGQASAQASPGSPESASASAPASVSASASGSRMPEPQSRIWQHLAAGELQVETNLLPLRLLLARLRTEMAASQEADVRALKSSKLHRFFVQNAHQLDHELAQILRLVP